MADCCYLCGKNFDLEFVIQHEEHIIQNAIGGRLKPNNILCRKCGDTLNDKIDNNFVYFFENFSTQLKIKKDRKTRPQKISGFLDDLEIHWDNFKIVPKNPYPKYDSQTTELKIFASKKRAENYKKEKQLIEGKDNIEKITPIENLANSGGILKYPFTLDNKIFKQGFAKIAIGFASYIGIKRDSLPLVLDTEKNKIKETITMIPFIPLNPLDKFIEIYYRNLLDSEPPHHCLIIYTAPYTEGNTNETKKLLICYIELFSTFQHYVVLNDNYAGEDVYECYAQKIFEQKDNEEYSFSYEDYISNSLQKIKDLTSSYFIYGNLKTLSKEEIFISHEISKYCELDMNERCLLENIKLYYPNIGNEQTLFEMGAFRRYFCNQDLEVLHYPDELIKFMNSEKCLNYTHFKFYALTCYISKVARNQFLKKWKIIEMEQWDKDYFEAEGDAYIEFLENDSGEFHFGYVHGYMSCHYLYHGLAVNFSWEGNDEMEKVWGNGDATIDNKTINKKDKNMLLGNLIFHNGDKSWFKAIPFSKQ